MLRALTVLVLLLATIAEAGERRMILVTPKGVWEAVVVDGVPGQLKAIDADVVVQGFGNDGNVPTPPNDDEDDNDGEEDLTAAEKKAKELAATTLNSKREALAAHAIIRTLVDEGLVGDDFFDAFDLAGDVADGSYRAEGRIKLYVKTATSLLRSGDVTREDLMTGLSSAYGIGSSTVAAVRGAVSGDSADTETIEALGLGELIALIKAIIELLKLGGILD